MPFIYPIPDMLSPEMTARLTARLALSDVPWVDGKGSAGRDATKKHNQEVDPTSKLRFEIAGMVQGALTDMVRKQALQRLLQNHRFHRRSSPLDPLTGS